VSLSTTEAELVAAALALKTAGLPVITSIEILKSMIQASNAAGTTDKTHKTVVRLHVDNQAMAAVIRSGRNPTMRHLSRTHGISISWLHEQCQDQLHIEYVTTTLMAADIYTKAFHDAIKWTNLCEQINIVEPADLAKPHIHALHALLLNTSAVVTGKKFMKILT
jgi:hypothetical protein